MITKSDIHEFLRSNNIGRDRTVLVHTSMRALGGVEGGCDGLIDAFKEYLDRGLFIVPTHTWAQIDKNNPTFDPKTEPSCIGALPDTAIKRKDGVRSLHPTHSVVAFGERARQFVLGEEKATSPGFPNGVWWRLREERAIILLLGVGLNRNTYLHAVDEMLNLPDRLCDPIRLTVIGYDGEKYEIDYRKHNDHTGSENFGNYEQAFLYLGALRYSSLGNARVGVVDAEKCALAMEKMWSRASFDLTQKPMDLPDSLYKD